MAHINIEKTFDALEIRDTNEHTGATINNFDFRVKTIVIENGLDRDAAFQCQASVHSDFSKIINIGSEWDVSATTNIYQTCETFFPYNRIIASCDTAPTSGDLTVHFIEHGE